MCLYARWIVFFSYYIWYIILKVLKIQYTCENLELLFFSLLLLDILLLLYWTTKSTNVPVSYTHLDVYKRQVFTSCKPTSSPPVILIITPFAPSIEVSSNGIWIASFARCV